MLTLRASSTACAGEIDDAKIKTKAMSGALATQQMRM
jgi:hypothetical protein